jgi:hypothetical protein
MKIRNGFISNSSSSSFIINGSTEFLIQHMPKNLIDPKTLVVPHIYGGQLEFGRQRDNYKDFGSRLNWAYLQAHHLTEMLAKNGNGYNENFWQRVKPFTEKYKQCINMLEEVLFENLEINKINWLLISDIDTKKWQDACDNEYQYSDDPLTLTGYIDHQSLWHDRQDMFEEIFESKETIFHWLFGIDNMICNRSDEYADAGDLEVDHREDYQAGLYRSQDND